MYGGGHLWAADLPLRPARTRMCLAVTRIDPRTKVMDGYASAEAVPGVPATPGRPCADGCPGLPRLVRKLRRSMGHRSFPGRKPDPGERGHRTRDAHHPLSREESRRPSSSTATSVWVAAWSAPQVVRVSAVGAAARPDLASWARQDALSRASGVAAGAGFIWATTPERRALAHRPEDERGEADRPALPADRSSGRCEECLGDGTRKVMRVTRVALLTG